MDNFEVIRAVNFGNRRAILLLGFEVETDPNQERSKEDIQPLSDALLEIRERNELNKQTERQ